MICWTFCFRFMFISLSIWTTFFCCLLTFITVVKNFAVHLIVSTQVIDFFLYILYNPLFWYRIIGILLPYIFPGGSDGKESACNAGDPGSIPGSGISPGEGNSNPLQYSCLKNLMDRGALWATVQRDTQSQT